MSRLAMGGRASSCQSVTQSQCEGGSAILKPTTEMSSGQNEHVKNKKRKCKHTWCHTRSQKHGGQLEQRTSRYFSPSFQYFSNVSLYSTGHSRTRVVPAVWHWCSFILAHLTSIWGAQRQQYSPCGRALMKSTYGSRKTNRKSSLQGWTTESNTKNNYSMWPDVWLTFHVAERASTAV